MGSGVVFSNDAEECMKWLRGKIATTDEDTGSQSDTARFMSLSADEIVDIVDENNQVLRQERRAVMRKERLLHRSTYIFARNSQGQFYVQKRTMIKDYCPGYYEAGETYAENAGREVEEELGIPPTAPKAHLFTFLYEDERLRVFGDAWEVVWDGELKLQPEEVESVHPMTLDEVFARVEAGDQFTPDSLYATRKYLEYMKEKSVIQQRERNASGCTKRLSSSSRHPPYFPLRMKTCSSFVSIA
ncbi:hypothetical protein VYU27_004132 [Nannochloropsis oceanica]